MSQKNKTVQHPRKNRDEIVSLLEQVLDKCTNYETLYTATTALIRQVIATVPIKVATTKEDNYVINHVDTCIKSYGEHFKVTKYEMIDEALLSEKIYGVILSVNGPCYVFHTEEDFKQFSYYFSSRIKYEKDLGLTYFNIYHVIPPNAQQKARLHYSSINAQELNRVKERLAIISETPEESIEVQNIGEDKSLIILGKVTGTWKEVDDTVGNLCHELLQRHNDSKLGKVEMVSIGGIMLPASKVVVQRDSQIVINYVLVNEGIINTGHVGGDIMQVGVKPKKKRTHDLADDWITQNPYKIKYTRGEYHTKYVKKMKKEDKKYLNAKDFSEIMRELGYVEHNATKKRTWIKTADEDIDSDSDEDKKNDDSDSE